MTIRTVKLILLSTAVAALSASCGGGSSSSSSSLVTSSPSSFAITTNQILPPTINSHSYSTTLNVTGGSGQFHWSIAPISSTALFVNGLSIDANSGLLSGTTNWFGTAGFVATVTDSASHTASQSFDITSYAPLTDTSLSENFQQYGSAIAFTTPPGGVPPYNYSLSSGTLPPGVQLTSNLSLGGSPTAAGAFQSTFVVHDSFSPPETATFTFNIAVAAAPLTAAIWLPNTLYVNRPLSGRVVASFGTPPYTFAATGPALPAWLTLDSATGLLSGTPTASGGLQISIGVTDSSSPTQHANATSSQIAIRVPRGRNDSIATATRLGAGTFVASISPYLDPPPTSEPGDNDYYSLVAVAGTLLHVETNAKRNNANDPLDTVLEILDANGHQLNWCNQPGATSTNFTSACLNDDISASPHIQDSALDLMAPGPAGTTTTVYAHVLDWRGDARPDMTYSLLVSGAVDPLQATVPGGTLILALGRPATNIGFSAFGGLAPYTWSAPSASMPPGVTITASGSLSGTPTTIGTYPVTLTVADAETPPQTASSPTTLRVADPPHITTTSLPDGQTGVAYNQPISVTGGTPPYTLGPAYAFGGLGLGIQNDLPVVTGTPSFTGTGIVSIEVFDQLGLGDAAQLNITITPGPLSASGTTATWKVGGSVITFIVPSGGTPPYSCALQNGGLPPGVVVTANNCSIGGTPTAPGSYAATILVSDSGSPAQTATATANITVTP